MEGFLDFFGNKATDLFVRDRRMQCLRLAATLAKSRLDLTRCLILKRIENLIGYRMGPRGTRLI